MRAVGFKEFGDPEVLEVMDIPEVSAGPGEIRIKNYASAVNPTDIVSRSGLISQFRKDFPLPSVPGMDISGTVDQVGEGVETGINIGDRVMGMVIPNELHGAYREQITLNQFAVVKAPEGYSFVESSTLPMNGLTARLSLDLLNLNKGQVIAVTGGPTYLPWIDFEPTLNAWSDAFSGSRGDFFATFFNSVWISVAASLIAVVFGSMAAYALVRFTFKVKLLAGVVFAASGMSCYLLAKEIFDWKDTTSMGFAFLCALILSVTSNRLPLPGPILRNNDVVFCVSLS